RSPYSRASRPSTQAPTNVNGPCDFARLVSAGCKRDKQPTLLSETRHRLYILTLQQENRQFYPFKASGKGLVHKLLRSDHGTPRCRVDTHAKNSAVHGKTNAHYDLLS